MVDASSTSFARAALDGVPSGTGSRPSDQAPTGLAAARFDPSRDNLFVSSLLSYATTCERYGLHVEAYGIRDAAKRLVEVEDRLTDAKCLAAEYLATAQHWERECELAKAEHSNG